MILETQRLILRQLESERDAEFILQLLNTPKFIRYIGDRNVRTAEEAADFIDNRYAASYREHGYGLYLVELKSAQNDVVSSRSHFNQIGICGFVRRETLPGPDIGFAFLPEFEGNGYGFESASAALKYGCDVLGFEKVFAITKPDNDASRKLLGKLDFEFSEEVINDGEHLKVFIYTHKKRTA